MLSVMYQHKKYPHHFFYFNPFILLLSQVCKDFPQLSAFTVNRSPVIYMFIRCAVYGRTFAN